MPTITILDMVLAGVMLLSGFLAMVRGVTRELLSIAAWVGAAGAAFFVFTNYQDEIKQLIPIHPEIAAVAGVTGLVFLVTLIIISLLTIKIGDRVLDSSVGALDRTLGFLFGLGRGLILVGIIFWFFLKFTNDKNQPDFIQNAYSHDIVQQTSDTLEGAGRRLIEKFGGKLGFAGANGEEDEQN